jgi:hypothetical protein
MCSPNVSAAEGFASDSQRAINVQTGRLFKRTLRQWQQIGFQEEVRECSGRTGHISGEASGRWRMNNRLGNTEEVEKDVGTRFFWFDPSGVLSEISVFS